MPYSYTCLNCESAFSSLDKRRKYCSTKCAYAHCQSRKLKRVTVTCLHCGRIFEVQPKLRDKMFCNVHCYSAFRGSHNIRTCEQCGKTYHRKRIGRDNHRFCSNACMGINRRTQPDKPCKHCGKTFNARMIHGKRQEYCSHKCGCTGKQTAVTLKCATCKKPFRVIAMRATTAKFCSRRCKSHFNGETIPEQKIRRTLTRLRIPFEQEKSCGNGKSNYSIDFFIPSLNIALEVDGVYWHASRAAHDAKRNSYLLSRGIRTVRVTDTEINTTFNLSQLVRDKLKGIHTLGI